MKKGMKQQRTKKGASIREMALDTPKLEKGKKKKRD